jgi:hypothetical protein
MEPGATEFTRIFSGASETASDSDLPARPHGRHEVHLDNRLPRARIISERETARVVDQDVHSSERGSSRDEKSVERLRVPDVAHRRVHRHGPGAELGLRDLQRRLAPGADGDTGPFLGQPDRDGPADTPARPGHDRRLSS